MSHLDASSDDRRGGGLFWFWTPILIILFVGAALSALAYMHGLGESPAGAIAAGFGGVVAVIVGVF
ncbi:MAG TPA: hypothetical protein VNH64_08260, partial [Parvularculaceae bacterium]|nr:hypothetical protein [Parvularculaceae bacterium]